MRSVTFLSPSLLDFENKINYEILELTSTINRSLIFPENKNEFFSYLKGFNRPKFWGEEAQLILTYRKYKPEKNLFILRLNKHFIRIQKQPDQTYLLKRLSSQTLILEACHFLFRRKLKPPTKYFNELVTLIFLFMKWLRV